MNKGVCRKACRLLFAATLGIAATARAQSGVTDLPLPAPKPPSPATRRRLRAAVLQVMASAGPHDASDRAEFALRLAQLGDWKGAMRLILAGRNARGDADWLWQWRAYQLAEAGKWGGAEIAASYIGNAEIHSDALLFMARCMVDRHVALYSPTADSRFLEHLLHAAARPLARDSRIAQKAYDGYLWARSGDLDAAKRVFERTYREARQSDAQIAASLKVSNSVPLFKERHLTTGTVLHFEEQAGLSSAAAEHVDTNDQWMMSDLIKTARTRADFNVMDKVIAKCPPGLRAGFTCELAIVCGACGDRDAGMARFDQARKIETSQADSVAHIDDVVPVKPYVFMAAHVLHAGPAIEAQAEADMRASFAESSAIRGFSQEHLDSLPAYLDLQLAANLGIPDPPPSLSELERITEKLMAARPSDLQFRALQVVADYYFKRKQPDASLTSGTRDLPVNSPSPAGGEAVAQAMLKTARALYAADAARHDWYDPRMVSFSHVPYMITALYYFQRAGGMATAARLAAEFARIAPAREKPYGALLLGRLGFVRLGRSMYDPSTDIRSYTVDRRAGKIGRCEFDVLPGYAGAEAAAIGADAPFRWYTQLPSAPIRSRVLLQWLAALFPEPVQQQPFSHIIPGFIRISGNGDDTPAD